MVRIEPPPPIAPTVTPRPTPIGTIHQATRSALRTSADFAASLNPSEGAIHDGYG